jgi:hypothetical protein
MYGLVNKAIQDLVCEKFGDDKWQTIKKMSDFEDDMFIGLQSYPDELTYKLVKNASMVLGADASIVMETFGEYWILYTAQEGYGNLLDLAGNNLPDFLDNLDMLHSRLSNLMPSLAAPQFSTRNKTDNSIELEYRSTRDGFSPMVIGLLKGLCKRLEIQNTTVLHIETKQQNGECEVFKITW